MGTLNVSFRCVENVQRVLEGASVCYSNNLYEGSLEIPKAFDQTKESTDAQITRAAHKLKPPRTTADYLRKAIRKQLKAAELPKKIYNAEIVITYMWDEYQLAENGTLY